MTQASSADWEMAIILPLGVVANQLRRIEEQLRLLDMKALDFARVCESRALRERVDARLEQINEALGSVGGLVSDIEADLRPRFAGVTRASVKEEVLLFGTPVPSGDARDSRDTVGPEHSRRRPRHDVDD